MAKKSLFDLTGKVAVVTGASKGIGKAIAEHMALHGARVVVSSRHLADCEALAREIVADGGEAIARTCDITEIEDLRGLVDSTLAHWGRIDILVCNAAINPYFGRSYDIPEEAYDQTMTANVKRNFQLCNMVLPHMADLGGGSIIIVSSIGGMQGSDTIGVYNISKAADMQLARNIALEWGPRNIRANCLAPGLIKTEFSREIWENPQNSVVQSLQQNPIQRIGEPEEVAGMAVCLASQAGAFITGQAIIIDGGKLIGRLPL